MISKKLEVLGLSTLLFAGLVNHSALAAVPANTGTITIAVAANFTVTLTTITQNFLKAFPLPTYDYHVNLVSDSSGNLLTTIKNNNGVNTYDLFLSADKARPDTLVLLPKLAVPTSEWLYAVGELEYWSPVNNVSAGIVYPLKQNTVLANPATAPYGTVAATLLNTISHGVIPFPVPTGTTYNTLPNSVNPFVNVKANITLTKSAITSTGTIKEGFIHQSSICSQSGTTKSFTRGGGFHHTYGYNDPTYPHAKIAQYGIKLVNSARAVGSGSDNLLSNFQNYLNTTAAKNVITGACYALN